jgi:hypothetical protein
MILVLLTASTANAEALRKQTRRDETALRNITTIPGLNFGKSDPAPSTASSLGVRELGQKGGTDASKCPRLLVRVWV